MLPTVFHTQAFFKGHPGFYLAPAKSDEGMDTSFKITITDLKAKTLWRRQGVEKMPLPTGMLMRKTGSGRLRGDRGFTKNYQLGRGKHKKPERGEDDSGLTAVNTIEAHFSKDPAALVALLPGLGLQTVPSMKVVKLFSTFPSLDYWLPENFRPTLPGLPRRAVTLVPIRDFIDCFCLSSRRPAGIDC
ncbi:hypothetical protein LEMLEM_LOCUS14622 [Lemmus lemmus]